MVFNATFNNISVISCRSVLLVEETGGPGENHRPVASCKDISTVEIAYRKHDVLQMMNVPRVNPVLYSSIFLNVAYVFYFPVQIHVI